MKFNFQRGNQRCGFYDENLLPHGGPELERQRRDISFDRYNREDPCIGMKQIITGFSKWSTRYISSCSGQKTYSHQVKRMKKWGGILNKVLECVAQDPETTSEPISSSYTFDLNLIDRFVDTLGGLDISLYPITGFMINEGNTVRISGSCYSEYTVRNHGCAHLSHN